MELMRRFFIKLFNVKCVEFVNIVNGLKSTWMNRFDKRNMYMHYLMKFFDKERNILVNFFARKKGKLAEKVI